MDKEEAQVSTADVSAPQTSSNVSWQQGLVSRNQRWANMGQQGATLWFTGLSGAGKSTLVFTLEEMLLGLHVKTCVLDGDNMRHGLNSDLGFSLQDRAENVRRVGEVSRLCAEAGLLALASFISPQRVDRDRVRRMHNDSQLRFIEIHVDTPLAVCEERDPKDLYRRARSGEIKGFTGIDSPYEIPEHAELVVMHGDSPAANCGRIIQYLQKQGLAPGF